MSIITTNIELALTQLQQGNIVAIPTETVYGLAGNADNEDAVRKIYALKNRPLNHPLIMHVAQDWDLSQWVSTIPDYAKILMQHFWPGPLTLVFQSQAKRVSPSITGGQATVAIRCPKHPIAQTLLSRLGMPLVAPSANPFGKVSPTTAQHVQKSFADSDLLILDGGRCEVGIESTIIAATHPDAYQILRPGMIDESALRRLLPGRELNEFTTLRVPGRLAKHYQPEKTLYCFPDQQRMLQFCQQQAQKPYVLSFAKNTVFKDYPGYQLPDNADMTAFELYFQLRRADQSDASLLVIELPPDTSDWRAVRERIMKAGQTKA